jgi:hypothetical protein
MKTLKVNCYNKETRDMVNKQARDSKGKFVKVRVLPYVLVVILLLAITVLGVNWKVPQESNYFPVDKVIVKDTAKEIIEKEKNDILDTLEMCESSGDANAIVWVDGGIGKNTASFGAYMFKVGTIQAFKDGLTDFQAIALASDRNQSRELAEYIIFETDGGIYNWKNCMNKYGLFERVKFIKSLLLKTK